VHVFGPNMNPMRPMCLDGGMTSLNIFSAEKKKNRFVSCYLFLSVCLLVCLFVVE
jgi:hypothetical protein